MKLLSFIIFCLLSLAGLSQSQYDSAKISPFIKKITSQISAIAGHSSMEENFHTISDRFDFYTGQLKLLQQRAKMHELVELVNHPNPFIRISAFNFLLDSGYSKFVDVIEQHITDTSFIFLISSNCVWLQSNVIEGMLELVSSNNNWVGRFDFGEAEITRLAAVGDKYRNNKKKN